jgi:hypothetical protein
MEVELKLSKDLVMNNKPPKYTKVADLLAAQINGDCQADLSADVRRRLTRKIYPWDTVYDVSGDLYDLLQLLMARNIIEMVKSGNQSDLLGQIMICQKYCDPLYHKKSLKIVFDVIKSTGPSDVVHEVIAAYYQKVGLPNELDVALMQSMLSSVSFVSYRTAARYCDNADNILKTVLIKVGFDVFGTGSDKVKGVVQTEREPLSEVESLQTPAREKDGANQKGIGAILRQYSLDAYAYMPPAYGVSLPITDCVPRQFTQYGRPAALSTENMVIDCIGKSGVLVTNPGAGITTAIRRIAYRSSRLSTTHPFVICISALEYLENANKDLAYIPYLAAMVVPKGDDRWSLSRVAGKLEELNELMRLVIFIDDISKMDDTSRAFVISKFVGARMAYFCVTPWFEYEVIQLMQRYGVGNESISLRLTDLDQVNREKVIRKLALPLKVKCDEVDCKAIQSSFGGSILEVGAYLASGYAGKNLYNLAFAWELFAEFIRRSGIKNPCLAERAGDLDSLMQELISFGAYLNNQLMFSSSDWLEANTTNDMINISTATLLSTGLLQTSRFSSRVRVALEPVMWLLCILGYYYFGERKYSLFDKLSINATYLDNVRRQADLVPDLIRIISLAARGGS